LPVGVNYLETAVYVFNSPWRRESPH
jgi:hypothetical protein